ncbi:uncharacterized protein LOC119675716 [Teleopsis dalmanni]|uniref:uncharacterized protein LOC119675716 n=1 Tax=Teleopsis dalmanni TaxID=139649 RepID=UPI0018CCB73E|nr:uncharacterized protein LOC119675716 [Teleopsis dalmanni]
MLGNAKGRGVIEDLPRSGRPSTSNTEENVPKIKKIVLEDRRMTEREIARDLNISYGSVHHILRDILGMTRVAARLVPKHNNRNQSTIKNLSSCYSTSLRPPALCDHKVGYSYNTIAYPSINKFRLL